MAGASGAGGTYIDPLIGARLGGYAVEAALGRGAMGAVYRAVQLSLNRRVALKVMIPHLSGREDLVARFRREAMAAAALNHPNIVQVYDFGEEAGVCFYVMELVDGLSLGDYLNRGERFSEKEIIEVGREVTLALECAHGAGIIHRDLKPDNLMLTSRGMVKLADLGLARVQDLESDVALTLSGMSMGTPLYMSPEQAQGEKTVDHRADFYSLGATLFHLATGRVPFDGQTAGAILMKQVHEPPPDARALNPSLGQGFADLMRWMMATRQIDRPAAHGQILESLERCHADALRRESAGSQGPSRIVSSTIAPAPRPEAPPRQVEVFVKQGKGWPIWAACGGVFLAIAVAGWLATRPAEEPTQVSTTEGTEITKEEPVPAAPAPAPEIVEPMRILGDDAAPTAAPAPPTPAPAPTPVAAQPEKKTEVGAPTPPPVTPVAAAAAKPFATPEELMAATKEKPFVNSLGMRFVPIPGTRVLFSIWETRVRDFEVFVKESGYKWNEKAGFEQTPDDPVEQVSWYDAKAFCEWLSKKGGLECRMPTDEEWDSAVGKDDFPWGEDWPPPKAAGNFAGEESKLGQVDDPDRGVLTGYRDEYPRIAPVGSCRPHQYGLYDLSGNVWEYCEDWFDEAIYKRRLASGGSKLNTENLAVIQKGNLRKVARGGSFNTSARDQLRSAYRGMPDPGQRSRSYGFRCALVAPAAFPALAEEVPALTLKLERPNIRGRVVVWPLYKGVKDEPGLAQLPEELKTADDICAISASSSNASNREGNLPHGLGVVLGADGRVIVWGAFHGTRTSPALSRVTDVVALTTTERSLAVLSAHGRLATQPTNVSPPADLLDVVRLCTSQNGHVMLALRKGGSVVAFGDRAQVPSLPTERVGIVQAHSYCTSEMTGTLVLGGDGVVIADGCYKVVDRTRRITSFVADHSVALLTGDGEVLYFSPTENRIDVKKYAGLPKIRKIAGRLRGVYENRRGCLAAMDRKGDWHFVGEGLDVKGCEEASKNCIDIAFGNEHAIGLKVDDIKAAMAAEDEYEAKIRALLAPGAASAEGGAPSDEGKKAAPAAAVPSGVFKPEEAKELDGILAPLREAMASAKGAADERIARWVKELEEIERKVAGRTDLDGALKVRHEREAWAAGRRTPKPEASAKMPAEYSNPRYFLDRDLGLLDSRAESAIKKETSRALSGLRALEAKLTRATRLKAALAVREIAAGVEKGEVPGAVGGANPASPVQPSSGASSPPTPASPPPSGETVSSPKDATKDKPFVNSLGMRFVPIKGTKVLFSIWETRVRDFEAFVKESGYKWNAKPPFEQGPDHPLVMVVWDDARAFCDWLGKKEGLAYRLPTDEEWDKAAGRDVYPWGDDWPPPKMSENIAGEESKLGDLLDPSAVALGYKDDHPRTAPVGRYRPTNAGLYDMGGNVREWVEDWYTEALYKKHIEGGAYAVPAEQSKEIKMGNVRRVVRGGTWYFGGPGNCVSSCRAPVAPSVRAERHGFRCVLVLP